MDKISAPYPAGRIDFSIIARFLYFNLHSTDPLRSEQSERAAPLRGEEPQATSNLSGHAISPPKYSGHMGYT